MAPPVDLRAIRVRAGGRTILGPVDLTVGAGERWVLLGPNGSGKTTLLSVAGAWRQPSSGEAWVLGERLGRIDVRRHRRRIGHVSQALADRFRPTIGVLDAVLTGAVAAIEPWGWTFEDRERAMAEALLERVGCASLAGRELGTCSQGERQRILLARALMGERELLLLDEPAAGLDLPGRERLLRAIETAEGPAWILTTHHLEEIPPNATHAALLREGEVVAAGPIATTLTGDHLSRAMGIEVAVAAEGGRWRAVAGDPG
jgi:iron complex transport system ATP-binding protein